MTSGTESPRKDGSPPAVVALGASAGGIEALQEFLSAIPDDLGLAFVVIVHLAPDRESDLPEILARSTGMPVEQVGHHETAELSPNRLYVIAPDCKLEVTDTSIEASRFDEPRGQRAAIDLFFRSLAARHGAGFAVVLSGSGSDGALGAKSVKEAGGVVLVQDPREAGHDGMPRAAISTGVADVVLPVRELAERLVQLAHNKTRLSAVVQAIEQELPFDEAEEKSLRAIFEILRRRTRHDFTKYKRGTVSRRIARRMQLNQQMSLSDYLAYLKQDAAEVQALFEDLLIGVTTFFRDPAAWEALQKQVISPLIEQAEADASFRAWVPGCATGEEAYTLAILFQEEIEEHRPDCTVTVFASDIDEGALAIAREGIYPEAISTDVSQVRLERHFSLQDSHYRVAGNIRDRVVFATHSLFRDPPFSRLDLVSCRNLLIYLDRELQEQVMRLFQYACSPDAYLFLGVSENADEDIFRPIDRKHRIFQAQKTADEERVALPSLLANPGGMMKLERELRSAARQPATGIHMQALEANAPPSMLIDRQRNILHLSDSAARYLKQRGGPIARRITDVVRPELRGEVYMVLHRAFEDSVEQQLSQFVSVKFNGKPRRVAALAQRHHQSDSGGDYVLLTFLEAGEATGEQLAADVQPDNDAVRGLREKLRQAEIRADGISDDYLQANEDLLAANEELQSLNEEYRSTTEELETSKEELQSINEELQTVNYELKRKVEALTKSNDDLENLMTATGIPTLFLDRELKIKRFTPQIVDIFNISSRDSGRPLTNFTHRLDDDAFLEDARAVLTNNTPIERETKTDDERIFFLRATPYQTSHNQIEGVVLTLFDITRLKHAEAEFRESEQKFRALVESSSQIVWTRDAAGGLAEDSPSWRAFTGQTEEEWRTRWLDAVHPEDRAAAEREWNEAVRDGKPMATEFRVCHAPSQTYRWTTVRATPLKDADGTVRGWVGMHIDVHESKKAEQTLRDADRRKDEFLALLGHELRNPLAAIRSSVAVYQASSGQDDTRSRTWAIIERQSAHMTRLINDLLDIVRIDRGMMRLERTVVPLNERIADVVEAFQPRVESARLTLDINLPDEPLWVDADPERLAQILDNLLRNAISFTDPGGKILLRVRQKDNDAVISITDSGVGMEPEQIQTLFEPYHQADRSRAGSGLGLGLTLVKRLVEMHGGAVAASSEGLGAGSKFEITLSLVKEPKSSAQEPLSMPPARQVLVVDDEADVADMFGALLTSIGQDVVVAYSGEQAIKAVRENAPRVAFLDLAMPGMGGSELARRLRKELGREAVFLVALSGYGIENRADDGEFDHHLLKPASIKSVVELLNSLPT